ncbi:hypothetical protein B0H66DRAFT_604483 [Apodospora peruviana]|uniref:Uncharacterized protein n=1 Tax=Apodospora peruviana TaxID=516989 RepID=A0AAE0M1Z9_9PEZI|nr:hypothetical protein B0H66DRAFT_604483 [Apodospora peruviana]
MVDTINKINSHQASALQEQKDRYRRHIKELTRQVKKKSLIIEQQQHQIDIKNKEIKTLEKCKNIMADQMGPMEDTLKSCEDRIQALEKELKTSRVNLEDAIDEHRGQYNRSQKMIEEGMSKHEQALEMLKGVKMDVEEKAKLHGRIAALTQTVDEKNTQLGRMEAAFQPLSQKLEFQKSTTYSMESLASQYKTVISLLEEQRMQAANQRQTVNEVLSAKSDAIAKRLDSLTRAASVQPQILSQIEHIFSEATIIAPKLDTILASQTTARDFTNQVSTELEKYTEKIQNQLRHRDETTNQHLEQVKENSRLGSLLKEKEAECKHHEINLESEKELSQTLKARIHELEESLAMMDATEYESAQTAQQLHALQYEVNSLEELKSKSTKIKELEDKLVADDLSHLAEAKQLSAQIVKFNQIIQEKDAASRAEADRAADIARREVHINMERDVSELKKRLHQTEQHRDSLAEQLRKLSQNASDNERFKCEDAIMIAQLKESLSAAKRDYETIAKQKREQISNLEQARDRELARLESLRTEVAVSKSKATEPEANAHDQTVKIQGFISKLQQLKGQKGLEAVWKSFECFFQGDMGLDEFGLVVNRDLERFLASHTAEVVNEAANLQHDVQIEGGVGLLSSSRIRHGPLPQAHSDDGPQSGQTDYDDITRSAAGNDEMGRQISGNDIVGNGLPPAFLLSQTRRVVVRSPSNFEHGPSPATSIIQEQARRRLGIHPKPILKHVTENEANSDQPSSGPALVTSTQIGQSQSSPKPVVLPRLRSSPSPGNYSTPTVKTSDNVAKRSTGRRQKRKQVDDVGDDEVLSGPPKRTRAQAKKLSPTPEEVGAVKSAENKSLPASKQIETRGGRVNERQTQPVLGRTSRGSKKSTPQPDEAAKPPPVARPSGRRTYNSQKSAQSIQLGSEVDAQ